MKQILKTLLEDCKPYIDTLRQCDRGNLLVRAYKGEIHELELFDHNLEFRPPLNTPLEIHNRVNELLESKLGWKVRNGIFSYGINILEHEPYDLGYGKNYFVFPKGDFEFAYSLNVFDFFGLISHNKLDDNQLLETLDYQSTNLCKAIKTITDEEHFSNEIMLKAHQYYLVDIRMKEQVINLIWDK